MYSSMPRWMASSEHAELMMPVPPMNRNFMSNYLSQQK
jgi:hypothetical protein